MMYLFKCFPVVICISNNHIPEFFRMEKFNNLLVTQFVKSSLKLFIKCLYRDVEDVIDILRNVVSPLMKQKMISAYCNTVNKTGGGGEKDDKNTVRDSGLGVRLAAAAERSPNKGKAGTCAIFARLPVCSPPILEGGSAVPRGSLRHPPVCYSWIKHESFGSPAGAVPLHRDSGPASLVTEGLRFGILLLEKCCWDGWSAQVMVPATATTGWDKKWRAACLLPGYCEFCWHKGCPPPGVGQILGTAHLSCINPCEQLSTSGGWGEGTA